MDSIQAMADAVVVRLPQVTAFAVAYILASRISLRRWAAVKALPAAPILAKTSWGGKLLKLVFILCLVCILALEILVVQYAPPALVDGFFTMLFGAYIFVQTAWTIASIMPFATVLPMKMHRTHIGTATARLDNDGISKKRRFLGGVGLAGLSAALTAAVLLNERPGEMTTFFLTVVVLVPMGAQPLSAKTSIRRTIIGMLIFEAFYFISSAALAFFVLSSTSAAFAGADDEPFPAKDFNFCGLNRLAALIFPAMYASYNAFLISACYRFDYARVPAPEGEEQPEVLFNDDGLASVPIPASLPRTVGGKPYFIVSLLLTLLSHAIAPAVYTLVPGIANFGQFAASITIGWMGLFIAVPVAAAGVLTLAAVKGEFSEMWRHEEHWCKKEKFVGMVKLPADDHADAEKAPLIVELE